MLVDSKLSVKELATKFKLTKETTCHCNGFLTKKFSDGTYTLSWRKHRYMVSFRKRNEIILSWTKITNLETFLNNFYAEKN